MNPYTVSLLVLAIIALAMAALHLWRAQPLREIAAFNAGSRGVTKDGTVTMLATATHGGKVLVKRTSTDGVYAVAGSTDEPFGYVYGACTDTNQPNTVFLLGHYPGTIELTASEALATTDKVFPAASEKVQNLPGSGTHYQVGRPLYAASGDGSAVIVQHCFPLKVVVS